MSDEDAAWPAEHEPEAWAAYLDLLEGEWSAMAVRLVWRYGGVSFAASVLPGRDETPVPAPPLALLTDCQPVGPPVAPALAGADRELLAA